MKSDTSPATRLLPGWIRDHPVTCMHCKFVGTLRPDVWFQPYDRMPFDFGNEHLAHLNPQVWVNPPQVGCPSCNQDTFIIPPLTDEVGVVELRVDETNRTLANGEQVYVFAAVGVETKWVAPERFDASNLNEVTERVRGLKRAVEPGRDPTSWSLHMKEITSGQKRAKHPFMRDWEHAALPSGLTKLEHVKSGVFEILRNEHVLKFVVVVPHQQDEQGAKEAALHMLILGTLDAFGKLGRSVVLRLDSQKPVKPGREGQPVEHGWATAAVRRFRGVLLYQFLTRMRVRLPEPVFVKPGSEPLAELADVVAFTVGRAFELRSKGQTSEYDPAMLGHAAWMGLTEGGAITKLGTGVPWGAFRPIL